MEGIGTPRILVTRLHLPITIFGVDKTHKMCVHTDTHTSVKKSHGYLFYWEMLYYTESKDMDWTPLIFYSV